MHDMMMNLIAIDLSTRAFGSEALRDRLVDDFCHAVAAQEAQGRLSDPERFFLDYCAAHPDFNALATEGVPAACAA